MAEKAGAKVLCVAVVVDRGDVAEQKVNQAGWKYLAALDLADLGIEGD